MFFGEKEKDNKKREVLSCEKLRFEKEKGGEGGWCYPSDALRSLCITADPHS